MAGPRHEHEFEPVPGLPEPLPAGERMLWQGAPEARWMARKVFHVPLVAGYFALLLGWQAAAAWRDGADTTGVISALLGSLSLAALALALLYLLAWLSARTTLYTVTDRRVVMRVGIVLTVSYNLPLRCIDAAHVHRLRGGHGDLAFELQPDTRIAYPHLWPHVRPWRLRRTQPMLRCLRNVDDVAAVLGRAWSAANQAAVPPSAVGRVRSDAAAPGPGGRPAMTSAAALVAGR